MPGCEVKCSTDFGEAISLMDCGGWTGRKGFCEGLAPSLLWQEVRLRQTSQTCQTFLAAASEEPAVAKVAGLQHLRNLRQFCAMV